MKMEAYNDVSQKGGVNAALLVKPKYIHLWNIVKPAERKGRTTATQLVKISVLSTHRL